VNPEEIQLISRCQQGDQEALKEIFDKYHNKVLCPKHLKISLKEIKV
jgi:hypothetical protein